jgi:hypothetical protein
VIASAIVKAALAAAVLVAFAVIPAGAAQGPDVKPVLQGTRGNGDWWRSSVRLSWDIAPAPDSTDGCDTRTLGQDTAGASFTCNASIGGVTTSVSVVIRIDATPPVGVTATAARPTDVAGWYTSPVRVTWTGSDGLSGIASCASIGYGGPDVVGGTLSGDCTDQAGNVSVPVPFGLSFDATPPALGTLSAVARLGRVTLRWIPPADAVKVTVTRRASTAGGRSRTLPASAVRSGLAVDTRLAPGVRYRWTVSAGDAAGNTITTGTSATWKPPVLRWKRRHRATYYNVQLFRGSRKVLSAWPHKNRVVLKGRWRFAGRTRALEPGPYRWFAWPGYGSRAARRYGTLIARGHFTVR